MGKMVDDLIILAIEVYFKIKKLSWRKELQWIEGETIVEEVVEIDESGKYVVIARETVVELLPVEKKRLMDPWGERYVSLLAHILPKEAREEWMGDLKEACCELIDKGYSRWAISLITWGRVLLLGWSLLSIRYQDLVSPKSKERQGK